MTDALAKCPNCNGDGKTMETAFDGNCESAWAHAHIGNGGWSSARTQKAPVLGVAEAAMEWQAVARNMAQVLVNTAAWIEEWEQGGFSTRVLPSIVQPAYLRSVFANQLAAHNLNVED